MVPEWSSGWDGLMHIPTSFYYSSKLSSSLRPYNTERLSIYALIYDDMIYFIGPDCVGLMTWL